MASSQSMAQSRNHTPNNSPMPNTNPEAIQSTMSAIVARWGRVVLTIILLAYWTVQGFAQTLTPAPSAYQTVLDTSGNPVNNAKICTYLAGTSTPTATYSDSSGSLNANPIRADTAGRFTMFLTIGTSYKLVFQDASGTVGTCDGATIRTVDGVAAVPGAAPALDVTGTAGVSITAGQVVYLGAAGTWLLGDATTTTASTTPWVGIAPNAILSGATGTIRLGGSVTGLTGLSAGSTYYVSGTPGALTSTAPTNSRALGVADTTSSLVLEGNPPAAAKWTLLKANSGTDTSAGATVVDSYAMASQLTAKDRLVVITTVESVTQATATPILQNSTDTVTVLSATNGGAMTAGDITQQTAWISDAQSATTTVLATGAGAVTTNTTEGGGFTVGKRTTFTTAWTGAWTLALKHGGVTAGGTFKWSWAIWLVRGE